MEMSTEHVWEAFHTPLWQFIRKQVPDEQGAEDNLQNVFLKVHTHIDMIRQQEKLPRDEYQPRHHRCATQPHQVVCVSSTRQGGNHV